MTPPQTTPNRKSPIDIALDILEKYGFTATKALAEEKIRTSDSARSVVIVGEVKRGKSALVNALLEAPNASPVDVDVTTSAALQLVPESEKYPPGFAELVFPGETRRVPMAELPDWVTQKGRYVSDPTIDSLPTRAIVPVPNDIFDGAVVVDTPGTGGLEAAHAQMAVRSAQKACVLVVVADASAPLTAPEMDFIKQTSATVESIIVVITKTDKNLRRWRSIVDKDRQLLEQHLQRRLPVLGVSSVRAAVACEFPPGPQRDGYLQSSGIAALRELILHRMEVGGDYEVIAGMRTALEGLRKVDEKIAKDIAATKENAKAIPELTEERDRLKELKARSSEWEMRFNGDIGLAQTSALEQLDHTLNEIKDRWTTRINKHGMEVLRKNPQVFTADIEADLMAAVVSTMDQFLKNVYAVTQPLFDSPEPWAAVYRKVTEKLVKPDTLSVTQVQGKAQGLFDPSVMSLGLSGSSLASVVGAAMGVTVTAATGIGAVAAVTWLGVNLCFRALRSGRNNLLKWLGETMANTRSVANRLVSTALLSARTEIVVRYRRQVNEQIDEVSKRLADAQKVAQQDAATRQETLTRMSKNRQIVTKAINDLEAEIAKYTAAINNPPAAQQALPAAGAVPAPLAQGGPR